MTAPEIKRLFHTRAGRIVIAVQALAPILLATDLFGLGGRYYSGTMSSVLILQPAGLAVIAAIFASVLLTLSEMHRVIKYNMNAIIETAASPIMNAIRRTAAVLCAAAFGTFLSLCVLLPYTWAVMGEVFDFKVFILCWLTVYLGGILVAVLLASGFYMISKSLEASFILIGGMLLLSLAVNSTRNYLMAWAQTSVLTLSDSTGSYLQFDVILYIRLIWLIAAAAVYTLGLACIRRYGKNLIRSFLHSVKKAVLPAIALLLAFGGLVLAGNEPFFDNGPMLKYERYVDEQTGIVVYNTDEDIFFFNPQINRQINISSGTVDVTIDTDRRILNGIARYTIINSSSVKQTAEFGIEPGLDFKEVSANGERIGFEKNKQDNFMESVYHIRLPAEKNIELVIKYEGSPRNRRDYQMRVSGITDKYIFLSKLYPILSGSDKSLTFKVNLPDYFTPFVTHADLTEIPCEKKGIRTYQYKSSYPGWFIAGDYIVDEVKAGGTDILFMYFRGAEPIVQKNGGSERVADIVDFFSDKFGRLNRGSPFIVAELDAAVGGGWAFPNISVMSEGSFAGGAFKAVPGSENREGGVGIGTLVHEIAHQWWGIGVYAAEDGKSPWSSEGLTVYSTYLYMKDRFGEEYAKTHFTDVWKQKSLKMQNAFYLLNLQYANKLPEDDAVNIYEGFSGSTKYELMPYMLLMAQEKAGSEDVFVSKLAEIYDGYRNNELSYDQFLSLIGLTKEDLKLG
jgi:hypothetical protein